MLERNKLKAIFVITLFITIVLLVALSIIMMLKKNHKLKNEFQINLGKAYIPYILNEHDMLLITADDTIQLAFENAYNLSDEHVVYVMQ